jgi:hypothetical protein
MVGRVSVPAITRKEDGSGGLKNPAFSLLLPAPETWQLKPYPLGCEM